MFTEKNKSEANQEIYLLAEILKNPNSLWLTDLDDTIKESEKITWPDGIQRKFYPETVIAFMALKNLGLKIGIVTEQTYTQIEPFIADITSIATGSKNPRDIFNGIIIEEGGSVINTIERGQVVVAPKKAIEDKEKIVNWLWKNVSKTNNEGWAILNGSNPKESTYVQLPPKEDLCIATASLWEKGPHVSENPEYVQRYSKIESVVQNAIKTLNITTLTTYEAGNGTLRIVPKFVNKAHSAELISAVGILDLSKSVYSCDGPNDIRLTQKIISKGGGVVAVANAVSEIHRLATYSAKQKSGKGISEAVSLMFPNEYKSAEVQFHQHLRLL